ncbi:MAG: FecR family protein [Sneathiellaceae bacterium]
MRNAMTRSAGYLCAGLLLAAAAAGPVRADAQDIGYVEKIQNRVVAEQGGASRQLATAKPIIFRDLLRSEADARMQAVLLDKTQITLGENAVLQIDEFVYTPGRQGGSLAMRVTQGAFLFVGGEVEAPSGGNVTIETPVGTMGIRGTTVWGGPLDGQYGVTVLSGEVTVTNAGGSVTLQEGQGTMIRNAETAPGAPAAWPEDRMDRAVKTISFGG